MGTSPTAYLREVRLRRAHQSLLESDPSTTSVASIGYHWVFNNLGRFAAEYAARYHQLPAQTLRRRAFRRLASAYDARFPLAGVHRLKVGSLHLVCH